MAIGLFNKENLKKYLALKKVVLTDSALKELETQTKTFLNAATATAKFGKEHILEAGNKVKLHKRHF
ncbi:MAG TPA: hypothetical protein VMW25_06330 [Clostridia bacterium]|nr:hypothetical protein [Clostridia bacterium]